MIEQLQLALQLRKERKLKESNELLIQLAMQHPTDAYLQYQCAWSFDCLGEEAKAVSYYQAAIAGDLNADDLQSAYLGLGSTFRALGQYEKSQEIFEQALKNFPENKALKVFYAMTLYNLNEHQQAMSLLLHNAAETSDDANLQKYKRAISFYADHLNEIWK